MLVVRNQPVTSRHLAAQTWRDASGAEFDGNAVVAALLPHYKREHGRHCTAAIVRAWLFTDAIYKTRTAGGLEFTRTA